MEDGEGGRAGGTCIQIVKGFVYLIHSAGDGGENILRSSKGASKCQA